jgi:SAM-dependent methyltransferase
MTPLANAYRRPEDLERPEVFYPLVAYVCESCHLVQLPSLVDPGTLFGEYLYFSSYSRTWVEHCRRYATEMVPRFGLTRSSQVIEVASNDGHLLRCFADQGIPVLGIEPARNVAEVARSGGIPTVARFFGEEVAMDLTAGGDQADLLVANNVLAHVPDLTGFVRGIRTVLSERGVATLEFPHLERLIEDRAFDTIYHEHFSYFSFTTVVSLFAGHGLRVFDVDELPTHGGSLRIYACRDEDDTHAPSPGVTALLAREEDWGVRRVETYTAFRESVRGMKRELLGNLVELKSRGASIVGYGAPAKGNTLLNYCGIGTDFLDYTVDRSPHKQGRYLPGTRIPIHAPERIDQTKPDYVLILPWNLTDEITEQMAHVRSWGGRFLVPIPEFEVIE